MLCIWLVQPAVFDGSGHLITARHHECFLKVKAQAQNITNRGELQGSGIYHYLLYQKGGKG